MKTHRFPITAALLALGLSPNISALTPMSVDIQANNSDTAIGVTGDDPVSARISIQPFNSGNADWWAVIQEGDQFLHYDLTQGWIPGIAASYQGPLFSFENLEIFNSTLEAGFYTLYFGVDTDMDGQLDLDQLTFDSVKVHRHLAQSDVTDGEPFVDIYDPSKTCSGTTLLSDTHDSQNPRIIELNMLGEITWQYDIPESIQASGMIGLDAEYLDNGNILFNLSNSGIYEINRDGEIQWSHLDLDNSHDADRLSNGNTLYVFGNDDTSEDAQAKEVDSSGTTVWQWKAVDHYNSQEYLDLERQGWTHINGATRLSSGNTLLSLRNFDLTVEVDGSGTPVWSVDWRDYGGSTTDPHEPEIQSNDNLLVCMQRSSPYRALEVERESGDIVWSYSNNDMRTARDCDRLPNGNTLILAVMENGTEEDLGDDESVIIEVTEEGEIVWRMKLKNILVGQSPGVFYKAERQCN